MFYRNSISFSVKTYNFSLGGCPTAGDGDGGNGNCHGNGHEAKTRKDKNIREVVKTIIHARDPPLGGVSKEDTTGHPH